MHFLLLFLEGIITFISPCLLPMLPLYISYFAAGQAEKRRALSNALGFVCGFTLIFVSLGAFAGTVGRLLIRYTFAVNITAAIIVILLGLNFLGIINIDFLNRHRNMNSAASAVMGKKLHFFSSVLFGIIFSVLCSPCVGAFLGSALMKASIHGSISTGMLMLLVYSMGLAVPFVLSALLIDRMKDAFDFIKRNYNVINIVSGLFLILMGILMATGLMGRFLTISFH